jgi:hypothetical protein
MAGNITEGVIFVEDVFRKGNPSSAEDASSKPRQPSLVSCIEEGAFGLRLPCQTAYLPLLNSRNSRT